MTDKDCETCLTVLVRETLDFHVQAGSGGDWCERCSENWPCAQQRIAADWKRQHEDLCRAWKNRTGKEVFFVRKFACAVCSEKDTGLVCAECIAEASRDEAFERDLAHE